MIQNSLLLTARRGKRHQHLVSSHPANSFDRFCLFTVESTKRDQTASLLYILKRRGPEKHPFSNFLSALEEEYPFIADTLRQHFFQLKEKSKHNTIHLTNRKCPSCQFTEHLIPKDITHQLFQQKVLTDDELKALNNDKIPVKERNFMLLDILRTHVKPRESITILKATLSRKYAHLLETLGSCSSTRDLPSLCTCLDQDTTEDDEPSPLRTATSCDEQPNNKVVLFESVQKLSLENNSSLKTCGNLWGKYFDLRERGDWEKLQQLSDASFRRYSDNIDIQVMLYRVQLCIYTFYLIDMEKANQIYDKVMTLLSRTQFPLWHLALILALKVEICTKNRQFERAQTLLRDAKQAVDSLSPCFSTGTVFLFEAKYLTSFLKCNPRSRSAGSIRNRIRTAYLTAIHHYQKDKVFRIKPFSNQVYLFLALFALGIDPADSPFEDIGQRSDEAELSLAEHYLNLFENTCWDNATLWSKMHFYLGRAEQHRQRNNATRALDYFYSGLEMATKGDFKVHVNFTTRHIKQLEGIHQAALLHKERELIVEELLQSSD